MKLRVHNKISEIPESAWNSLVTEKNPFVSYGFLSAMEKHGCVGEKFGWLPRHLAVYQEDEIVGVVPLYEKYNSYGEFVFDHAWADAWQRADLAYFPKLVAAVPYTPVVGPRLLVKQGYEEQVFPLIKDGFHSLAETVNASSIHCLFSEQNAQDYLEKENWLVRHDCQFHWQNQNYQSFDDFLQKLKSKKRKNIRQERSKVQKAGVNIRRLDGYSATQEDWRHFAYFYQRTFDTKWGIATFNQAFFEEVAAKIPDQVLLVLADLNGETIAGALMFRNENRLFGRHWGCTQHVDSLHFEVCYYQGIEYAIANELEVFEPGAGGEHKIARGFSPQQTRSAHWVYEPGFVKPIENYIRHEQEAVAEYIAQQINDSPYK